jgi:predicted GH43/DUF377 family glycosyl hydrolase
LPWAAQFEKIIGLQYRLLTLVLLLMSMHNRPTRQQLAALPAVAVVFWTASAAIAPAESARDQQASTAVAFPSELVEWTPCVENPVFTAEGPGHWDVKIRERGWILREGGIHHLWFTGYDGTRDGIKLLGYATSCDGINWTRSPKNPLRPDHWVEDMMVVKRGDTYYMFAEGSNDNHSVMLTSSDRMNWKWNGPLDVRLADGKTKVEEPCGTPTIWIEHDTWYLFYERLDKGVWLATTSDVCSKIWSNVRDEPVLVPGPSQYDDEMIALNQVICRDGAYYAFYHGSGDDGSPRRWNTNVARSIDLIHWQKYAGNPIIEDNKSSAIVVRNGPGYRLYTMHDQVDVFTPRQRTAKPRR